MSRVLFVTSEIYPLVKTGGLGDVSYSLPIALRSMGEDVKVIVPGYPAVMEQAETLEYIGDLNGFMIPENTRLFEGVLPGTDVTLWVVDCPSYFVRNGGPYIDCSKQEWPDNAHRFAMFARAVSELALGRTEQAWMPDVVHCNDWQAGLVPALLSLSDDRPATVFTIHNLAYQGNFSKDVFDQLMLPHYWWDMHHLEFYNKLSFLKAGIVYSDKIITVSPTYANEILNHEYGYGMDGLLKHYQSKLAGILNGADYNVWSPEIDEYIKCTYDIDSLDEKVNNKLDLQRSLGLQAAKGTPLIGMVCRLVHQKGVDYVLDAIKANINEKLQWVILGNGEPEYEQALVDLAEQYPKKISVTLGYSEELAHKIEASADMFLMASRYEPCGLNQMYSLRYGTLPIVRATGGLADTVVDVSKESILQKTATGFVFNEPNSESLSVALLNACRYFRKKKTWRKLQLNAMALDYSWDQSALGYLKIYDAAILHARSGRSMPV